ncbi:bifunctional shikimate kinase/3-dehydroquinate synthase [Georgenia halophila]|uniref:Multifunctional fusion protein n=1 Tax=Georgenia halophila TaxID=620889 RepID=A0ABP8L8Q5_9MICO
MSRSGPRAVLVGLPGAGKSTVGRRVARALGVDFLDTDTALEESAGTTVPDYFRHHGEASFRALEHDVVTRTLAEHDGVLALGGGAVLDPRTRAALAAHPVVLLEVGVDDALDRLRGSAERPLLVGDPAGRLARLREERAPVYAEVATTVVDTTGRSTRDVAEEIVRLLPTRIPVGGADGYDVVVGNGLDHEVVRAVTGAGPAALAPRAFVAHAPATAQRARRVAAVLEGAGVGAVLHELPDAEDAKALDAAAACWDHLGTERFGREDVVVAVGGGATTDVAGFVAASWLRGVRLVNVPTTLLGMVDAAVGGKTGINTAAGKNLVGSFHPPSAVVCDLDTLTTLPAPDLRAGLAEVVKCGFIAEEEILHLVEADDGRAATDASAPVLRRLVELAVAVKARVVGEDLHEAGLREILNYGHTFAHAVERVEGYRWRHGDAVAVGMVFVAELAHAAGLLDAALVTRHRRVLEAVGLPTAYSGASWEELAEAMAHDKKVRGNALRFIVLTDVAHPTVLRDPAPEHLQAAYGAVSRAVGSAL